MGALVDLGGSPKSLGKVAEIVERNLPGVNHVRVKTTRVERGEISAQLVEVSSEEKVSKRKASDLQSSAMKCARALGLSERGAAFVKSVLDTLSSAESRVHGQSAKEIELHELGSADTLVDILGVWPNLSKPGPRRRRNPASPQVSHENEEYPIRIDNTHGRGNSSQPSKRTCE